MDRVVAVILAVAAVVAVFGGYPITALVLILLAAGFAQEGPVGALRQTGRRW